VAGGQLAVASYCEACLGSIDCRIFSRQRSRRSLTSLKRPALSGEHVAETQAASARLLM
jgi:hypothetical protein